MTEEEKNKEIESLRRFSAKICESKDSARNFLIQYGFIDENGQLSEQYRSCDENLENEKSD